MSCSDDFSDGIDSQGKKDFKNSKENNESKNIEELINWEQVTDLKNYNEYLKFDDEHFPLASFRPQDKYVEYEPYDIFNLFFTDELINNIVDSSNENIKSIRDSLNFTISKKCRKDLHYCFLNANEFRVFLGIKIHFNFRNNSRVDGIY